MNTLLTPDNSPTAEEWNVPEGYELVDGRLVELNMGNEAAWVENRIGARLDTFASARSLGWVLGSEAGYRCFPHRPRLLRKPDVSFVRAGRFPGDRPPRGDSRIAPDLAVEVVSPNDLAESIQEKVVDYLTAGVPLVWVVYPTARMAIVYRPGGAAWVSDQGELDGEDVIPGFRCRLADVLLPPEPRTDAADEAASDA
jgi:Uma2 family endonuclease